MKVRLKLVIARNKQRQVSFQFHEGPIKTMPFYLLLKHYISFNSMKVRLKHDPCQKWVAHTEFQFHEGPIKTATTTTRQTTI